MSQSLDQLREVLRSATTSYRKGPEIVERTEAGIHVAEVYAMPPVPKEATGLVDVHFMMLGFDQVALAAWDADRLRAALLDNPQGDFTAMSPADWASGPSYIRVGGWIGSHHLALSLFALGEHLGLWKVITPATFGVEGAKAQEMAGAGYVMTSGLVAR